MNKEFLGAPFKSVMLVLLLAFIGVLGFSPKNVDAQNWKNDKLLMDLQSGGAEMFKDVSGSIVQIYNSGLLTPWQGGGGSGYVIDKEGHAITNKHVVGDQSIVEVQFFEDDISTGDHYTAVVIGEDPSLDMAIIKINAPPEKLDPIKLADTLKVEVGDAVATLGSPGGDVGNAFRGNNPAPGQAPSHASSDWLDFFNYNLGVVDEVVDFPHSSIIYTYMGKGQYGQLYGSGVQYMIHVSAAINHGNSGGPCINAYGEAIGTNTWGFGGENAGYSVPVNLLKRSAREIIEYGRPMTPWCGIICHPPEMPPQFGYESQLGLANKWQLWFDPESDQKKIYHVNPYSPAYKAGLREGDIILSIDNNDYKNIFDFYKSILNGKIGQKMTFMIERDGNGLPPITVELAEKKVRYDSVRMEMAGSSSNIQTASPNYSALTY